MLTPSIESSSQNCIHWAHASQSQTKVCITDCCTGLFVMHHGQINEAGTYEIYSEAIKSIQFLVLNTGSHVNGCVKMFILSFCRTSGSSKRKPEMLCSH